MLRNGKLKLTQFILVENVHLYGKITIRHVNINICQITKLNGRCERNMN